MMIFVTAALAADAWTEVSALAEHRNDRQVAEVIPDSARKAASEGKRQAGVHAPGDGGLATGWGVAVWDLPVEAVWKAINNEDQASDFLAPAHSGTVDGAAHHSGRSSFQYISAPVVTDRWWITTWTFNAELYRLTEGAMWEVSFVDNNDPAMLEGTTFHSLLADSMPIADAAGGWLVIPLSDGRTWVEYLSQADPGGNIPSGLMGKFADREVLSTFDAIEARAVYHQTAGAEGYVRPDGSELE